MVFQLDGTLTFGSTYPWNAERSVIACPLLSIFTIASHPTSQCCRYIKAWPRTDHKSVLECLEFHNVTNFTFSSSGEGQLDGKGAKWWGIPGIGYLVRQENRYRLYQKLEHAHARHQLTLSVAHSRGFVNTFPSLCMFKDHGCYG